MKKQTLINGTVSTLALACSTLFTAPVLATEVLMRTNLGDIRVDLFEDEAPLTVENFLNYLRSGRYEDSIIHRSVPDFVIQGGGFQFRTALLENIVTDAPVQNEPGISNTRGTIAMAKRSGDANSATSQWFFNIVDNDFLDSQNGGFTVFGEVSQDSLTVIDEINDLRRVNVVSNPALGELPVVDWEPGDELLRENFVLLSIEELNDFEINAGLNDAWFNPATNGQGFFLNVFPDAGSMFLSWFTYDVNRPGSDATATLGEPGHRWVTAQGPFSGDRATLTATLTSGGVFDSGDPAPINDTGYGTIDIVFTGCDQAEVTYNFPGQSLSGTVPIQRIVKDNVALCEALGEETTTR